MQIQIQWHAEHTRVSDNVM